MIDYVVCDLDGTICDIRHRQHLAQAGDWDAFHELLVDDAPRHVALAVVKLLMGSMAEDGSQPKLIFLTGRPERYRPETKVWLASEAQLFEDDDYVTLIMRGNHQNGSDTVVKEANLEEYLAGQYGEAITREYWAQRVLVLDDRDKVVAHFRDLGYEAWQVAEGAY